MAFLTNVQELKELFKRVEYWLFFLFISLPNCVFRGICYVKSKIQ